jgi:hypothetical protein
MNRRRYQLSIRQMMLLILLGTVWVQLHASWSNYHRQVRLEQKLRAFGLVIQRKPAFNLPPLNSFPDDPSEPISQNLGLD